MKKIKTINKILSSLTLLSPLSGVGFNNQYQNTQKVITENSNNSLNNYVANKTNAQRTMGDITVNVQGTIITTFISSSGEGKLIVDSDITEIGQNAFKDNTSITSLDLSQATSLTTIGENAFSSCNKLAQKITIPNSVVTISSQAFINSPITELDLSQATNLTTIGRYAFGSCSNLTGQLVIPSSLTTLDEYSFSNSSINSLDLSNATNLTIIANSSFSGCSNLTGSIVIPENVNSIDGYAFQETNITSLDFSNAKNLRTISYNAFASCQNLSGGIIFPTTLENIYSGVFQNCNNIENLTFLSETPPKFEADWQPTSLMGKVYVPTEAAKEAYLAASNFGFSEEKISVFSELVKMGDITVNVQDTKIISYQGGEGTLEISPTIIEIGENAFVNNTKITNINFGNESKLQIISSNAFQNCASLKEVDIMFPNSLKTIAINAFNSSVVQNVIFLSETPASFGTDWQPTVTGKIYVPSEQAKQAYLSAENFSFTEDQIKIGLPNDNKSNTGLILGLVFGLGIPILAAVGFGIWYFTKKKK